MTSKKTDVIIVGLGASGALLARELTESGMTVLGIEKVRTTARMISG